VCLTVLLSLALSRICIQLFSLYCTRFHFLALGQPGGGPKRGKGRGGGTAHNRPHPSSHSSIARAVSRDAARLERQKLNRDWDEVSERDRSQRVVEHKLILLRFDAFVLVVGVATPTFCYCGTLLLRACTLIHRQRNTNTSLSD